MRTTLRIDWLAHDENEVDKDSSFGVAFGMSVKSPLVISYLRFSRPEQMRGDSLRRQLDLSEKWATDRGMTITNSLRDLGVSAFRGKNTTKGTLTDFLKLVEDGKVPEGSILLVEELDRLSRQTPEKSLPLFLGIVESGVTVVTLRDGCEYRKGDIDTGKLMMSVLRLALAHEESAKKSHRLLKAWEQKRATAATKVLTSRLPTWCKLDSTGKIEVIEEKAAIVREIFTLTANGFGIQAVQKKLNAKYRGIARADFLSRAYVSKVLREKAVLGQFQLGRYEHGEGTPKRVPIGEPIKDYFPRIVTDDLYYAAQTSRQGRIKAKGRSSKYVNIFPGLLFNAEDKSPMILQSRRHRVYTSHAAVNGIPGAAKFHGVPAACVEIATLMVLSDVASFAPEDNTGSEVESLFAQRAETVKKIEAITESAVNGTLNSTVISLLNRLHARLDDLTQKLDAARGREASRSRNVLVASTERLGEIIALIGQGALPLDTRMELRGIVSRLVDRIEVSVSKAGGRLFQVESRLRLFDGREVRFQYEGKFKKSNDPTKRGFLTWLHPDDTHTLKIDANADGELSFTMSKTISTESAST